jgi:hypothetical protein
MEAADKPAAWRHCGRFSMAAIGSGRLADIAHLMRALQRSSDAKMFYELLSDSLVWTDEIPEVEASQVGGLRALRFVFRYRTSMMLGTPEARYRPYWDEAQSLFPDWPGFAADRRDASLRSAYESFRVEAIRDMEALFGHSG